VETAKTPLLKRPIVRILVIWSIQTVALIIMTWLMQRVTIDSLGTAILAALVIGLLNALLWPLLSYVITPFAVLTLGLAALLMNGFMVWLAAQLVPGFEVSSYWGAFWLALGLTLINMIASSLLTIDDDSTWYRNVVKRKMRRIAKPEPTDVPGILFLEIDGLARPILEKAMANGYMPTLKDWLESGSHVLTGWEPDTSSQTSASQAGILHGNNSNMPAFRWFDKPSGQVISSSDPKLLPQIEADHSDGNGLLADEGCSRGNMFSGDAPNVMTTASAIRDLNRHHASNFQAFFANPYNVPRLLFNFLWDIVKEKQQFRWARKNNVQPILDKHHRGGTYPFIRAAMTVLMPELNVNTLLGDMFAGRPAAYATFVAYDEIAHHSGIEDPGAFDALSKLDRHFGRLQRSIKEASRPYHLVVLSDHGQTAGATFLQRYGLTLQQFVQQLMQQDVTVAAGGGSGDEVGMTNLSLMLTDALHNDSSTSSTVVGTVFKRQMVDGQVVLGEENREEARKQANKEMDREEQPDVYALASGNLGLVSFTQWPERMTFEQIEEVFPAVIPGLAQHEGIGFVMVDSQQHGPMVIGADGIYHLRDDRVEGENPLAVFGPRAADHLRRTSSFPNCPDLVVNSFYNPAKNEGCAFEELIGFHGGLGGTQTQPFILHPAEFSVEDPLVGAASVYKLCKGWLNDIQGQRIGNDMVK
jgi:uncharacterized membrane protein YvlD (DUF360 family)